MATMRTKCTFCKRGNLIVVEPGIETETATIVRTTSTLTETWGYVDRDEPGGWAAAEEPDRGDEASEPEEEVVFTDDEIQPSDGATYVVCERCGRVDQDHQLNEIDAEAAVDVELRRMPQQRRRKKAVAA